MRAQCRWVLLGEDPQRAGSDVRYRDKQGPEVAEGESQ